MTDPNSPYEKYDSVLVPKCGFTYSGKTFCILEYQKGRNRNNLYAGR